MGFRDAGPFRSLPDGDEHGVVRFSLVGAVEVRLPAVEVPEPDRRGVVPFVRIIVGNTRECVDGRDVGTLVPGDKERRDGEILVMAAREPLAPRECLRNVS